MEKYESIDCLIIGIQSYGLFVECNQQTGLIHISEISDLYITSLSDIFSVGDIIKATVIGTDDAEGRLKLSYKKIHPIDEKIHKYIKIKKGFHPLRKALPIWIEDKEKNNGN